ncbi:hypothetical protein AAG906_024983 [Vitis piasezkii]
MEKFQQTLESSSSSHFVSISFNHSTSVKLENHNFLIWRKQIFSSIRGHNLQHFVTRIHDPPLKFRIQSGNKPNMQVLMATPENICDTNCYPDSGASNHVTANANNMVEHTPYYGNEQVRVGNGMRLSIKHISLSNLSEFQGSS